MRVGVRTHDDECSTGVGVFLERRRITNVGRYGLGAPREEQNYNTLESI